MTLTFKLSASAVVVSVIIMFYREYFCPSFYDLAFPGHKLDRTDVVQTTVASCKNMYSYSKCFAAFANVVVIAVLWYLSW